ncbi:MAG: hypothetical protein RJA10_1460, partial [Pseudomonadota bacterium]|jgi:EAL and modified HD-GYP domain-containing signal transduction protein
VQHRPIYNARRQLVAVDLALRGHAGAAVPAAADWLAALRADSDHTRGVDDATLVLHALDSVDLARLAESPPQAGAVVALPAELGRDPQNAAAMRALVARSIRLWSQGDAPADWPVGQPTWTCLPTQGRTLVSGVSRLADLSRAVEQGAVAGHGWPLDNPPPPPAPASKSASDVKIAMEVMHAADRAAPIGSIEATVQRSPTLTYRLMTYLSAASLGRTARDSSLRHALMMLGMNQLRQWASLLVCAAAGSEQSQPMVHASIWRAHFMQAVGAAVGPSMPSGELFVCGAFSLLDQLLGGSMRQLLSDLPVGDEVRACLLGEGGPLEPYLDLARAIESNAPLDLAAACDTTMLTAAEINRATLRAVAQMVASQR